MLKVNVGMSRKLTHDYNSTGFSVNVEGEILASLDDPELVLERIKELYDVAEESLIDQLKRHSDDVSVSRPQKHRRVESAPAISGKNQVSTGARVGQQSSAVRASSDSGRAADSYAKVGTKSDSVVSSNGAIIPATNKQVQFLLTLGKQRGLTKPQLEEDITEIVGRSTDVYGLTKAEAGLVLDRFTSGQEKSTRTGR